MRLLYEMDVIGADRIKRNLRSVESELKSHARTTEGIVGRATGRSGGSKRPSDVARGFDQIGRAARQADLRSARAAIKQEERDKVAAVQRVKREQVQAARATEQVARANRAAELQHTRRAIQLHTRGAAEIERSNRQALTTRRRSANSVGRGAASSLGSGVGNVVGIAGTALALGGGFSAASAISSGMALEDTSRRISIAGKRPGQASAFSPEEIQKRIQQTAETSGINPEKLAEGMAAAVDKTGDLAAAMANLNTVATVAQATGGDASDAYLLQADAMQKFGLNAEEAKVAMATLIEQGKKGAFTFKNMAALAPKAFAAAASFGFKGQAGLGQIGGLLQVSRDVTGSDEQAAFATEALLRQMTAKGMDMQSGKAFGGRKVSVFKGGDPRKGANNFRDILGGALTASEGNMAQLQDTFGEEGIRGMRPFLTTFRDTRENALKGGANREDANKAGAAAALKILDDATNVTADYKNVQADATEAMKSTTVQLEILNSKIKAAISSELLPAMQKLIPELTKLAPQLGTVARAAAELVTDFAKHPILGVGAVIAASVAKDIAGAAIGSGIQRAIAALIMRIAPGRLPVPGGGAVPAGAGGGSAIPLGLAAGAAAGGVALATNQSDKLQKELGLKSNLSDVLPGFKGGSFSVDQLLSDTMHPLQPGERGGKAVTDIIAGAHDAGRPEGEKWIRTMGKGVGNSGAASQAAAGMLDNKPLIDAGAALTQAADKQSAAADKIAVAMNIAPGGPRSGAPVAVR